MTDSTGYWVAVQPPTGWVFVHGPYTHNEAVERRQELISSGDPASRVSSIFPAESREHAGICAQYFLPKN